MSTNYASFEELTNSASKYLEDIGQSKQTVIIYNWIWKKVKVYMDNVHIEKCTPKTIVDYLNLTYGDQLIAKLTHHQKHCLRCALCLAQFAETNKMIEIIQRRGVIVLEGEIGGQMKQYINYKRSLRLNQKTLRGYSWYLWLFCKFVT
ncbi:phage integrase [Pedobacter cryoconitis]|uniref:Phage integrase n=1 Tax=Pedobacter cryoconitis TaxID=188932 RepID=A0A127VEU4_9SPHI|nr:hypothetical protein [Pedobacter cryoconitis]AMP99741.1 phage integrase [Pedobacter cryoconitis]